MSNYFQNKNRKKVFSFSSFHEMGIYDFPASIDFIINKTGYAKVDVLGYSLGATIALIGLSDKPEYNNKIDKLVLMAPSTRLTKLDFPLSLFYLYSPVFKVYILEYQSLPLKNCNIIIINYHYRRCI